MDLKNENISSITKYLEETLPHCDKKQIEDGLNWHLILSKHKTRTKKSLGKTKRKLLTRKQKKVLGLTKLPRNNWDYQKLAKINSMWKGYVLATLNHPEKLPSPDDNDYTNFCSILNKLELVGAEISVVRSNIPNYVGIQGIVVTETKFTIQLVTKTSELKILLKENCVFQAYLNNFRFTMFGKHFITRSGERSVKKIKYYTISDL